ncbi:MAG: hypothetical protein WC792_04885 [Candidatus Micrarchaeia archaeon]
MDKSKIVRWLTIGMIAMFVAEMFYIAFSQSSGPQQQELEATPIPTPLAQFSGAGIAGARVLSLSNKLYARCEANPNASAPSQIEGILANTPGLSLAAIEADGLYGAQMDNPTQDPENLSATVLLLQTSLEGKCLSNAAFYRDGFVALELGIPCTPGENVSYSENLTCIMNPATNQTKNLLFSDVSTYLKNQGLPGVPAFTNWGTAQNQSVKAYLSVRMLGPRVAYAVADEIAQQYEDAPVADETAPEANGTLPAAGDADAGGAPLPAENASAQ